MRYALALVFAALTLLPRPGLAALSGYYDSLEQIGQILGHPEVAAELKQGAILGLTKIGPGPEATIEWQIESANCKLSVYLRAVQPKSADGRPVLGKTSYEVARVGTCP